MENKVFMDKHIHPIDKATVISGKSYKVEGYYNKWYVIDEDDKYVLLENETYGDETFCLLVSKFAPVEKGVSKYGVPYDIIKSKLVYETYDDIETTRQDNLL